MTKATVKTQTLQKYEQNTLPELEAIISDLEAQHSAIQERILKQSTSTSSSPQSITKRAQKLSQTAHELTTELSAARHALQLRQRSIKAQAMEFERDNHHHLLFFCSTKGFVKVAGHSALFFAMTIADRIHWRYSLKVDTDRYSPSHDGIISFRAIDTIQERLAEINIFPNKQLTTTEFFYFELTKSYSDEQIAKLRDNSQRDIQRIMSIVLPASPIPALYDAIIQAGQLIYYQFKHLSDNLAKEALGTKMISLAYNMSISYLRYARRSTSKQPDPQHLVKIIESAQELRFGIAYASRLQILHHREVCQILEYLISAERIATKVYLKAKEKEKTKEKSDNVQK